MDLILRSLSSNLAWTDIIKLYLVEFHLSSQIRRIISFSSQNLGALLALQVNNMLWVNYS
jgi:hypothetical protein